MVEAVGDWGLRRMKFDAGYRVCFEKALVTGQSSSVTVIPADGSPTWSPKFDSQPNMEREVAGDEQNRDIAAARDLILSCLKDEK